MFISSWLHRHIKSYIYITIRKMINKNIRISKYSFKFLWKHKLYLFRIRKLLLNNCYILLWVSQDEVYTQSLNFILISLKSKVSILIWFFREFTSASTPNYFIDSLESHFCNTISFITSRTCYHIKSHLKWINVVHKFVKHLPSSIPKIPSFCSSFWVFLC